MHKLTYKKMNNYLPSIQVRVIDPGYNTRDYYEDYGYFRPLPKESRIMFLLNLKILKNDSHWGYKEPPGSSIQDPMEQLVCFGFYCLKKKLFEGFDILIKEV